ncbi:MAG: hypothetical protein ACLPX5_07535 [Dissulfurispiraceae bacterium]
MMDKEPMEMESKKLDMAEAEFMNIRQSTIRSVEGGHVELQQVGALSIDGERIDVTQGAAILMRGTNLSLNQSAAVVAVGNNTTLNFSCVPFTASAEKTEANRSAVGVMVAKEINSDNCTSLLMIGNNIHGSVTTLLDWRSALALGAISGGIFGLFALLSKR